MLFYMKTLVLSMLLLILGGCSTKDFRNLARNKADGMFEKHHFIMDKPEEDAKVGSRGKLIIKKKSYSLMNEDSAEMIFDRVELLKKKSGILSASTRYVQAEFKVLDSESPCKTLRLDYVVVMQNHYFSSGGHPALKMNFKTCQVDKNSSVFGICQLKDSDYYVFADTRLSESISILTSNKECFEYMKSIYK